MVVMDGVVAERERVRKLVDLVPAKDLDAAARMLRGLVEDQVLTAFANAPEDDEGEPSEESLAKLAEADQAIVEGRVVSHEELCRRLGL